jgi:undecaprenyl-diphosphatase
MKNKRGIWIFWLIVILFVVSLYLDSYSIEGISYIKNNFLDSSLIFLTSTIFEIIIFVLFTVMLLWKENKRKWVLPLWFTLTLSFLTSFILKVVIQRPRPFQQGLAEISSFLVKNSYSLWDFSFPSNHAMLAFCILPFVSKEFPKLKYIWFTIACIIGFSRVYFGFHFLSDVIAGAAIGYLIGALVIKSEKENHFWENIYQKIYNRFVR